MSTRTWKPVLGYEGVYEVSDDGCARSVSRVIQYADGRSRLYPSRPLSLSLGSHGYPMVNLSRGGAREARLLHRLVLEAFIGPCPPLQECRHLDGNRRNAALANLSWGTSAENSADTRRHGHDQRGENGPGSKLTESVVRENVLPSLAAGETQTAIARRLNVTQSAISRIASGETWPHLHLLEVSRG